ncbi:hypothetical protein Tco_1244772 [Tanacetum coccineum]
MYRFLTTLFKVALIYLVLLIYEVTLPNPYSAATHFGGVTVSEVNDSSKVLEQVSHVKRKTIIQTMDDDQIDSSIIFDDPFVENNGGTSGHDSNAHNKYHDIKMLAYNEKKAFKEQENRYLEDIIDLEEKLSSHDRIVYKMGGLGYQDPERLKKAIASQPKLYNGDSLHSANLIINSPDSEETLEAAEESRLKMRNKMVQINSNKLNALYETFVPQQEFSAEQTYFSIPSTSNNGFESKEEMLNIFESMEKQVAEMSPKETILENEIDRLLELSLTCEIRDCVLLSVEKQKNELLKDELEKSSNDSKDIQDNLL